MIDGKNNIRYLLVDMTNPSYNGLVTRFRLLHEQKEAGNKLTVLPNVANTRAVVKVVAHIGWIQDESSKMSADIGNGLILAVHPYEELDQVHAYLASSDWPQAEEL